MVYGHNELRRPLVANTHARYIKCRNYTLGVFVPEAKPKDTNITAGIISIWYFNKEPILNAPSEAEDILPMKNTHFILQKALKVLNVS